MGYPSEIPNAIPDPPPPPARGPFAHWLDRLLALFRRRKRRRSDAPETFAQGVDPRLPPLAHSDQRRLDFDEIAKKS